MFILKKELLMCVCCVMFVVSLYSENKDPEAPQGPEYKETYDTNFKLDAYDVDKTINDFKQKLKAELKGKKMPTTLIGSYAYKFKVYSLHPKIEEETEIYKSWYAKLSKYLSLMSYNKANFYSAKASKDAEKMQKCVLNYKKALNKCIALLKKPEKIKKEDLEKKKRGKR